MMLSHFSKLVRGACLAAAMAVAVPGFAQDKAAPKGAEKAAEKPAAKSPDVIIIGGLEELDAPLKALVASLTAPGTEVEAVPGEYAALDDAKIAKLNAAQLVILSRSANSGDYSADAEKWNGLKSPLLLMSPYFARASRWDWFATEDLNEADPPVLKKLTVNDPKDAAFAGMSLTSGSTVQIFDDPSTFTMRYLSSGLAGTAGKLGASIEGHNPSPTLVRWTEAGKPYYANGVQKAGGLRVFYAFQDDANRKADDSMRDELARLTPDGKKVLGNIIASMAPKLAAKPAAAASK